MDDFNGCALGKHIVAEAIIVMLFVPGRPPAAIPALPGYAVAV